MLTINKLRRALYASARILGDVNAISRGPAAIVKRIGRRIVYRTVNRAIGKVLR